MQPTEDGSRASAAMTARPLRRTLMDGIGRTLLSLVFVNAVIGKLGASPASPR